MSIKDLQSYWYEKLEENGFQDIEDHSLDFKPLKTWSGISIEFYNKNTEETTNMLDLFAHQEPLKSQQSCFPENIQHSEYDLLNSDEFDSICSWICRHGNRSITSETVKTIWIMHLDGLSTRLIGTRLEINHNLAFRIIRILKEWAFCE